MSQQFSVGSPRRTSPLSSPRRTSPPRSSLTRSLNFDPRTSSPSRVGSRSSYSSIADEANISPNLMPSAELRRRYPEIFPTQ